MRTWLAGHIAWPLTERLCGRDTMRRFRALRASDTWNPEQLRDLQNVRLRRLLRDAAEHIPFYAERFRQAGVDAADPNLTVDDLRHLPRLTRPEINANRERMVWHGAPGGTPKPYTTGGSSGEPLHFYIDAARSAADWAARWRARSWWGIVPGDPEVWIWGAPVEMRCQDWLRRLRDRLLRQHLLNAFNMSNETMDAYLDRIERLQPACLYGYASSLALLARRAIARGIAPLGDRLRWLEIIFATGEVLLEQDRDLIEKVFGVPVSIEYGCRDGGLLACGCPDRRLHVPQENVIVELLDDQGHPVAPGEVGEVTVTYLETYAMPLIRYRLGDLARAYAPEDRCPCGRASQTLIEVRGRVTDQIVCRDAHGTRRMHALALIYILREAPGLRQFRIVQPAIDQLEVQIIPDEGFTPVVERGVLDALAQRMGPDVAIRLQRCDTIPPSPSGKHACVISHVN
jgi:phenylacetate-CoA ligase